MLFKNNTKHKTNRTRRGIQCQENHSGGIFKLEKIRLFRKKKEKEEAKTNISLPTRKGIICFDYIKQNLNNIYIPLNVYWTSTPTNR